jgi:hypothetical protein
VAVTAVPRTWAQDLGTIISRVPADASVPDDRYYVTQVLRLAVTSQGANTEEVALKATINTWHRLYDVHPDNIDSVPEAKITEQLRARFGDQATQRAWIRRNMQFVEPDAFEEGRGMEPRMLLRSVMQFANTLEHCMQPRTFTTKSFQEADGTPREYTYLKEVELFVMCAMHAEMRVGEKIMNLLLTDLKGRRDLKKCVQKERWEQLQLLTNNIVHPNRAEAQQTPAPAPASADVAAPAYYESQHTPTEEEMGPVDNSQETWEQYCMDNLHDQQDELPEGMRAENPAESKFKFPLFAADRVEFRMDCKLQRLLFARFDELLAIVFQKGDNGEGCDSYLRQKQSLWLDGGVTYMGNGHDSGEMEREINDGDVEHGLEYASYNYLHIATQYSRIFKALQGKSDMEGSDIDALQLQMDDFCDDWVQTFGRKEVTNYIHAMQAGHFCYFLRRYRNIFRYQNVGMEGNVKVVRNFVNRGT